MRVAIVTGASLGLGRALSLELIRRGWTVVVDGRARQALDDLQVESAGPGHLITVVGDVTDDDHRRILVATAAGAGGLDLVVNNAGSLGPSPLPRLRSLDLDRFRELFDVNVVAALGLLQVALPEMRAGATVVNITSDAAVEGYEGWGAYGATKAALEQVGRVLAAEHPEVRVLTVDPGDMRTRMHQDAFPGEDISDRPSPEESVPGLVALIDGAQPSGRYRAGEVVPA